MFLHAQEINVYLDLTLQTILQKPGKLLKIYSTTYFF